MFNCLRSFSIHRMFFETSKLVKEIKSINLEILHVDYVKKVFSLSSFSSRSTTAILSYLVNVIPRFNFPAIFLERIIRSDLPVNLRALACRAESNFNGNMKMLTEDSLSRTSWPGISFDAAISEKDKMSPREVKKNYNTSNLGLTPPSSNELNSNWGVFGKVCRLDRPCVVDEVHLRRFDGLLVTD